MAIPYKDIRKLVRFKEQDNNEIRFSDYELKMAVNEVIRYISNSNALNNSDFNEKMVEYDEEKINEDAAKDNPETEPEHISFKYNGVELPEDFVSLVAVQGKPHVAEMLEPCLSSEIPGPWQYKVMGNAIFVGQKYFRLTYKAALSEIRQEEDEIDLPYMFKDNLVQLVRMVLNQAENDIMRDAVESAVQYLVPKRRYRNAKIRMPFTINNGRRGWR